MNNQVTRQKIKDFLKNESLGVLSTVDSKNRPYATTVYFVVDDEMNIYFLSKADTAKIENIGKNPNVMLVAFDSESQTNVQLSGIAEEISDEADSKNIFKKILEVTRRVSNADIPPISKVFAGRYVAYKIEPRLINYSVYNRKDLEMAVFETLEF